MESIRCDEKSHSLAYDIGLHCLRGTVRVSLFMAYLDPFSVCVCVCVCVCVRACVCVCAYKLSYYIARLTHEIEFPGLIHVQATYFLFSSS